MAPGIGGAHAPSKKFWAGLSGAMVFPARPHSSLSTTSGVLLACEGQLRFATTAVIGSDCERGRIRSLCPADCEQVLLPELAAGDCARHGHQLGAAVKPDDYVAKVAKGSRSRDRRPSRDRGAIRRGPDDRS